MDCDRDGGGIPVATDLVPVEEENRGPQYTTSEERKLISGGGVAAAAATTGVTILYGGGQKLIAEISHEDFMTRELDKLKAMKMIGQQADVFVDMMIVVMLSGFILLLVLYVIATVKRKGK